MNEQELHDVAMCVAKTYAETGYGVGVDAGEFGKTVAKAYAAARSELMVPTVGCSPPAPDVIAREELAWRQKMMAKAKDRAG